MATYTGYLYKRRLLMGTISEGSDYRIQINNSCSIPVCKRTYPWEDDPELEARLHNYISLSGEITGKGILYEVILAAKSPPSQIESHLAN
ncbi:hypothetical protein K8R78_00725 [bacterium]|nr:hypothetical protein [bacterium]